MTSSPVNRVSVFLPLRAALARHGALRHRRTLAASTWTVFALALLCAADGLAHASGPQDGVRPANGRLRSVRARATGGPTIRLLGVKTTSSGSLELVAVHHVAGTHVDATVYHLTEKPRRLMLPAQELIGLRWIDELCHADGCKKVRFRIVDGAPDSSKNNMDNHADNRDIWLYRVEYAALSSAQDDAWLPLCARDADGRARAMLVPGTWDARGAFFESGYTLACTGGAVAKCARTWGYKPWKTLRADDGARVPLGPLHRACVRAARADYCGDGTPHTRAGTIIDVIDRFGFNRKDSRASFTREAGFTEDGALWLTRPRWPDAMLPASTPLTCRRPASALARGRTALIEVWSMPRAPAGV